MPRHYTSWGRYPATEQTGSTCSWRGELGDRFAAVTSEHESTLAFGQGRSYGDSCHAASGHVVAMSAMNKVICADWESGRFCAEAGMTLDEVLKLCIPRGWFLPVSPGTKFVTLGGAVANDVHGKNHHKRGCFGNHVRRLGLLRSADGSLVCSPEDAPELFQATIGGLGLTGIIEWVEIQLMPVSSSRLEGVVQRFDDLSGFFDLTLALDEQYEYAAGWIDCTASGKSLGRGYYTAASHGDDEHLEYIPSGQLKVPVTPPISLLNGLSISAFNNLYWRMHPAEARKTTQEYNAVLYPLDGIREWNRAYGPKGFQQYQFVIPPDDARDVLVEVLETVAASGLGSILNVLKSFGDQISPGLLSFPKAGTTLALDFIKPDHAKLAALFERLDAIIRAADGRLYPAKDAHMSGDDFRRFYPAWEQLENLRDPLICSNFWKRVSA